jgi:hypothetical protein
VCKWMDAQNATKDMDQRRTVSELESRLEAVKKQLADKSTEVDAAVAAKLQLEDAVRVLTPLQQEARKIQVIICWC